MVESFSSKILYIFFTALGMIIGGTLIGSIAAVLTGDGPNRIMANLARDLKIWAAVAAIGGTFTSLQVLESGLLEGQFKTVVRQLSFFFSAFAGAHLGYLLILTVTGGKS